MSVPSPEIARPLARVLLVEDNPADVMVVKRALTRGEPFFEVEHAPDLASALGALDGGMGPDVVLLDLGLPDAVDLNGVVAVRRAAPTVPVVVLTGLDDDRSAHRALERGAQDYLVKDAFDKGAATRSIRYAIERQRMLSELEGLNAELQRANDQLERIARVDPLTGLLNRRGFDEVLATDAEQALRGGHELLALLVDLDDFKRINDGHGHSVGDAVLQEVANRLTRSIRPTDRGARVGGDEFMVLFSDTRPGECVRIAERLRVAIAGEPVTAGSDVLEVTASLGLAEVPVGESPSLDTLLAETHHALAVSKLGGKNQVAYANDGTEARTLDARAEVLDRLRKGEGLYAVLQPIVRLDSEEPVGWECYTRSSLVSFERPDDFLRISVEGDVLTLVDRQCFRVCSAAGGHIAADQRVHVNLLPSTLVEVPTPWLLEVLGEHRAVTSVCLEISERQIVGEPSYLRSALEVLREAGVRFALDDLGFGRSSLESLVLLEPDVVKLDRRCVASIARDASRRRALSRLVTVVDALGAEIVAEGVEEVDDARVLRELGVGFGQGYLWGRPETLEALGLTPPGET